MNLPAKLAILFVFTIAASQTFAAGDYIWESKFKKEMPKAEQGNVKSQYAIGEMYEKGKGAVRDNVNAFKWYVKAAGQGHNKAAYKVGLFYYKGIAVTQDYKKAHTWFTKSADNHYARAEFYLGEMYENGYGVSPNNTTALNWYKRALAGGYGRAVDSIKRVTSAKSKTRRIVESKKTIQKSPPKNTKKPLDTIDIVLKGGWKKRNRPVDYLPSSETDCKRTGENLECNSKLSTRNIGMADISYTTKAIVFGFKRDKSFRISYRNNVKSIKVTDEDFAETGEAVPVKLGWQDAEHKLECQVDDDNTISCTKNRSRDIKLTR